MILRKESLGFLKIPDGVLDITDPCYRQDSRFKEKIDVRAGNYRCNYYMCDTVTPQEKEEDAKFYDEFKEDNENFVKNYPTIEKYLEMTERDMKSRCWAIEISSTSEFKNSPVQFNSARWELLGKIGVDSGMAGFFNNKPDYDDEQWEELCNLCEKQPRQVVWNDKRFGFFSNSGYGDGVYDVYVMKSKQNDIIAVKIVFL